MKDFDPGQEECCEGCYQQWTFDPAPEDLHPPEWGCRVDGLQSACPVDRERYCRLCEDIDAAGKFIDERRPNKVVARKEYNENTLQRHLLACFLTDWIDDCYKDLGLPIIDPILDNFYAHYPESCLEAHRD